MAHGVLYKLPTLMAEKGQKRGSISISRGRLQMPKIIVAPRFSIRGEMKNDGYLELLFEPMDKSSPSERITFDVTIVRGNMDMFKQYAAGLQVEADDMAVAKDIPFPAASAFANILHLSHIGARAETIFGVLSFTDWADAARKAKKEDSNAEVNSVDVVTVFSTIALQKKLLMELIVTLKAT